VNISIFGLGYVGAVSAACFADLGHSVVGVDPNRTKVDLINAGKAPVVEADLGELTRRAVEQGRLRASCDAEEAVRATQVTFVCVGTPSQANGNLDLRYLEKVCAEIGAALARKKDFHVVVIRSTILPGAMRATAIPILERTSGKRAGVDFGLCNNPEFLREGTAVFDFRNPPKTVIGATDDYSGNLVQSLYDGLPGPVIRCANEIGKICKSLAIDSHQVMEIFCQDLKLNLSPYYLKPGFAFGGSCLPKDLRALTYRARSCDVATPLLSSVLTSNREHIEHGLALVLAARSKSVGFLGFSFKAGTDDLRESPLVEVIERLIGKGYDLKLYDRSVNIARLTGANRDYILKAIPHIERLMVATMDEVIEHSDVIVIGNRAPEFASVASRLRRNQLVIDFVRIAEIEQHHENYDGICW